jgi:hypothetical protein
MPRIEPELALPMRFDTLDPAMVSIACLNGLGEKNPKKKMPARFGSHWGFP